MLVISTLLQYPCQPYTFHLINIKGKQKHDSRYYFPFYVRIARLSHVEESIAFNINLDKHDQINHMSQI